MTDCPECGTTMLEVDKIRAEKMNFVCPECAPEFVLKATVVGWGEE